MFSETRPTAGKKLPEDPVNNQQKSRWIVDPAICPLLPFLFSDDGYR